MTKALDIMITYNVINRIDNILLKLNDRRHENKYYHPKLITKLNDILIDAHKHRMTITH